MTSAELLSALEELCLMDVSWLSKHSGISAAAVRQVFTTDRKTPVPIALETIVLDMRKGMEALVRSWIDDFERGFLDTSPPKSLMLLRYSSEAAFQVLRPEIQVPESVYGVAVRRYADYLRGRGVSVALMMLHKETYLEWLGDRENSLDAQIEYVNGSKAFFGRGRLEKQLLGIVPIRAACLDWAEPEAWVAPSGAEVRSLVLMGRLVIPEYAKVLGLKYNNAYKHMRNWMNGKTDIPLESWRLLCEHVGKDNVLVSDSI